MSPTTLPPSAPGSSPTPASAPKPGPTPQKRERDIRLDFFRGLCLFIILTAHTFGNPWTLWIPARFGWSDAAEIFVFCSGMASAVAFGGTFVKAGWWYGTARILFRCWQIYWAQICVVLGITAFLISVDQILGHEDYSYLSRLPIVEFTNIPKQAIFGLFTVTWSPNYFDILPMYFVILLMVPVIMLLAKYDVRAAFAFSILIWLLANFEMLQIPWSLWNPEAEWFFNPFGWQLLFFTGFALMMGWIPKPPVRRDLVILCLVYVIVSVPLTYFRLRNHYPELKEFWSLIADFRNKTDEGILRYLHLLALAYLAYVFAGENGKRLRFRLADRIRRVGQQSLPVFLSTYFIAQFNGIVMRETREMTFVLDPVTMPWFTIDWTGFRIFVEMQSIDLERLAFVALINIFGYALLFVVAEIAFFFKQQPWRKKVAEAREAEAQRLAEPPSSAQKAAPN